uniref:Uncharacterized protein n=1 Tax=Anguilla anguilla TaxID=7936 RepID=A0A0E9VNN5_ANGAN
MHEHDCNCKLAGHSKFR